MHLVNIYVENGHFPFFLAGTYRNKILKDEVSVWSD